MSDLLFGLNFGGGLEINRSKTRYVNLSLILVLILTGLSCAAPDASFDHSSAHQLSSGETDSNRFDSNNQTATREQAAFLSKEYAQFRKSVVSKVEYDLLIDLKEHSDVFHGRTIISFYRNDASNSDLTLDFHQGTVKKIRINAIDIQPTYQQWFIELPAHYLNQGENRVEIEYEAPYANDGEGLHRYVDQQSGSQYLFTQFEAYAANKMFPCFDQPNLKAHFLLTVHAPKAWEVISSRREYRIEAKHEKHIWFFPKTDYFSTYVFSLHAGPFHKWEKDVTGIPSRLFVRQELKDYVQVDEWFGALEHSLDFFSDYFDFEYPFHKYDQLIVPDFNFGAMENVGAVTFTERFVKRSEKTQAAQRRLALVIAHEAAHMWFGNIVTMDWWNDLWLNESFATYMSYLAYSDTTEYGDVWHDFYSGIKAWAYEEDQYVTTHAITVPVHNTESVISILDGITYGKGASVLKQLPFYIGETTFKNAVRKHIKNNAYDNATLHDLIRAFEAEHGSSLANWQQEWLEQPGLNNIHVTFSCSGPSLSQIKIKQTAPEAFPVFRDQRVQVAGFNLTGNTELLWHTPMLYSGELSALSFESGGTESFESRGTEDLACPEIIYANYQDWGFVKVLLDDTAIHALQGGISNIDDLGTRLAFWQALWDSVLANQITLSAYTELALEHIAKEASIEVLDKVLSDIEQAFDYLYFTQRDAKLVEAPVSNAQAASQVITPDKAVTRGKAATPGKAATVSGLRLSLERYAYEAMLNAKTKSDQKRRWLDAFIYFAHSDTGLSGLRDLLMLPSESTVDEMGMYIDQDLRWSILKQLNRYAHKDYAALLKAEAQLDNSERGRRQFAVAELVQPDVDKKEQWVAALITYPTAEKLVLQRDVMKAIFPPEQGTLKNVVYQDILEQLGSISNKAGDMFLRHYGRYMAAGTCDLLSDKKLARAENVEVKHALAKQIRISRQLNQRCVSLVKTEQALNSIE